MESPLQAIDYRMVSMRPCRVNSYRLRIKALLDFYKPSVVILEDKLFKKGKRVTKIIETIKEEATKQHLPVHRYSREDIRSFFKTFVGDKVTKYEIASFIANEIPELKPKLKGKRKIWESEDYFMPVFDSFALAMTHYYHS